MVKDLNAAIAKASEGFERQKREFENSEFTRDEVEHWQNFILKAISRRGDHFLENPVILIHDTLDGFDVLYDNDKINRYRVGKFCEWCNSNGFIVVLQTGGLEVLTPNMQKEAEESFEIKCNKGSSFSEMWPKF